MAATAGSITGLAPEGCAAQTDAASAKAAQRGVRLSPPYSPQSTTSLAAPMSLRMDESTAQVVRREAAWATQLVRKLVSKCKTTFQRHDDILPSPISTSAPPEISDANRMPITAVDACCGLAFADNFRAGLGVGTYSRGQGFVIRKLPPDAHTRRGRNYTWSPPLFFTMNQAGAGVALGAERAQTILCLMSRQAVEQFHNPRFTLGADLLLFSTDSSETGMHPAVVGQQLEAASQWRHSSAFAYTLAQGVFMDLASLHGNAISPNKHLNHRVYGRDATPEEILSGGLQVRMTEMEPLYKLLDEAADMALTLTAQDRVALCSGLSARMADRYFDNPNEIIENLTPDQAREAFRAEEAEAQT